MMWLFWFWFWFVQMERALLERCPNTLLRRRAAEALKSQAQPRITVSDLALAPQRGLRPIATSMTTPMPTSMTSSMTTSMATSMPKSIPTPAVLPSYTSLAEIIPMPGSPMVERVTSPRTPMRNRLVEKAARAYLLPSDSFNKRNSQSKPWTQSFSRFLPRLSVFTMALNPFNAFSSAFNVFRIYLTGARAIQPQLGNSVSRSVSRSVSMPVQRTCYTHDLSIR
ncbi:hypothetical protein M758_2G059400 [Ceratodon purpureus]|nr:hypothetical protein M758_2G059400 [Ceratodon purpureus]